MEKLHVILRKISATLGVAYQQVRAKNKMQRQIILQKGQNTDRMS